MFIGPPWHAMPYPEVVDYKAAAVSIHFADTSKWANFGSKWVLEKNAPRDTSRMHPRWWTPQVPSPPPLLLRPDSCLHSNSSSDLPPLHAHTVHID